MPCALAGGQASHAPRAQLVGLAPVGAARALEPAGSWLDRRAVALLARCDCLCCAGTQAFPGRTHAPAIHEPVAKQTRERWGGSRREGAHLAKAQVSKVSAIPRLSSRRSANRAVPPGGVGSSALCLSRVGLAHGAGLAVAAGLAAEAGGCAWRFCGCVHREAKHDCYADVWTRILPPSSTVLDHSPRRGAQLTREALSNDVP